MRSRFLTNLPGDVSTKDGIEHLLALRARAHRGESIEHEQLITHRTTTTDNQVKLFLDRQYFKEGVFPAVASAQSSIHIAMLTFSSDLLGEAMVELILAKKAQNPDLKVRIITDVLGTDGGPWNTRKSLQNLKRLTAAGCEVAWNNFLSHGMEHRKLFVIDGRKALFGGACLSAEYYAKPQYRALMARAMEGEEEAIDALVALEKTAEGQEPEFHDYGMLYEGSAVRQLQVSFLQSWLVQGRKLDIADTAEVVTARYFPPSEQSPLGTAVKLSHSVPVAVSQIGTQLQRAVRSAGETLDCSFAYILIPEFVKELEAAARRGVKIRILVPGEEGIDRKMTFLAFRQRYDALFKAGDVRIFETPFYTHLKVMVMDGTKVFESTGNPEWFSWCNGWDEIALFDSPELGAEVEARVFDRDLQPERSTEITREAYEASSHWRRAQQKVAQQVFDTVFAPRRVAPAPAPEKLGPISDGSVEEEPG